MIGILPRLDEYEECWSRAIDINERVQVLCESMNYTYLDVWKDFVGSFKIYKKDGVHLKEKGVEVFAKKNGLLFESVAGKPDGRRGIKRPLTKGRKVKHNNGNKISCFYANARSLRNKFEELRGYVSQEKPDINFITETWVKTSVQNNKFSQRDSLK